MPGEPKNQQPFTRRIRRIVKKRAVQPKPSPGAERRAAVVAYSHKLVGIHETPDGSNDGPAVRKLQASTGAFRAPWCVSTVQDEDLHVLGSTYADRTANAYYYADYAQRHGHIVTKPIAGCAVVYHIGAGHIGRVVAVHPDGTFDAVEGNEGNAVRLVLRDPRHLRCTFVLRPEYR